MRLVLVDRRSVFPKRLFLTEKLTALPDFRNSLSASAVCAFNLSAITVAFSGPFRYQENPRSVWLSTPNPLPNFQVNRSLKQGQAAPHQNFTYTLNANKIFG